MRVSPIRTVSTVRERGATLVIVLWIALGLVSLTLYFAETVLSEFRASNHRIEGISAEQAVDAGLRYATAVLANRLTNGYTPETGTYLSAGAPLRIGHVDSSTDASPHFWFIGRDTNSLSPSRQVAFGLIDEASKVNLNSARSNVLFFLSDWNLELTEAILDWRSTNGPATTLSWYGMQAPSYECKQAPFETVDEMRLLAGASSEALQGEDLNRNGVLDLSELDDDRDGSASVGLLDLVTVYSREPNTYSNGTAKANIRMLTGASEFSQLLQQELGTARANEIMQRLGIQTGGQGTPQSFPSPLRLYQRGGFTLEEFELIHDKITTVEGDYIEGRININTASPRVLACLPGLSDAPDLVDQLVNYRLTNPSRLTSVAWVVEAIGQNNQDILGQLDSQDILTTQSYQFTADIAATGAFGRGYRRVRFVIDTATDYPRVIYRQDLTALGWALGEENRNNNLNGSLAKY